MRDILYILGLMAIIFFLAADFPVAVADVCRKEPSHVSFASYVELSPTVHAAYLEAARTSWQVRSGSRRRPVIGSLDSDVPLLSESLPEQEKVEFKKIDKLDSPIGSLDVNVCLLMPGSEGADISKFASKPQLSVPDNDSKKVFFTKDEMLSVEQFKKLKEIMQ